MAAPYDLIRVNGPLRACHVGTSYAPDTHLLQAGRADWHLLQLMPGGDPSEDALQLPPEALTRAFRFHLITA